MRLAAPAVKGRDGRLFILPHVARAAFIAVVRVEQGEIVEEKLVPNPYAKGEQRGRGRAVASMIAGLGVDVFVAKEIGEGMRAHLEQAGVRVHVTGRSYLDEAVRELLEEQVGDQPRD